MDSLCPPVTKKRTKQVVGMCPAHDFPMWLARLFLPFSLSLCLSRSQYFFKACSESSESLQQHQYILKRKNTHRPKMGHGEKVVSWGQGFV